MRTIPFIDTESLIIPRIIPFAGLMLLFVITTFALSLQINRQSTISQEIGLNQTAHAIVYHGGQLIHEQWQLRAFLSEVPPLDRASPDRASSIFSAIADHRAQIESHLQSLVLPADLSTMPTIATILKSVDQYRVQWTALQPLLQQTAEAPSDQTIRRQIEGKFVVMDRLLTQIVEGGQQLFTTRLTNWLGSLQYLNRLLLSATLVLLVTVLLVSYLFYLFFSMQTKVEQALRDSAKRLHAILDTIPDAVLRLRRNGDIIDHKPAQLYQPFTKASCIGESLDRIVPAPIAIRLQESAAQVFATGEQQAIEYRLPFASQQDDDLSHQIGVRAVGEIELREEDVRVVPPASTPLERIFEARFLPTANDEIQLLVRDITTEKAADAATLQAQKLESIGLLAGGIAHDFNNILTGLLAQATLARRKAEQGLPITANLDKAILSTNRAADLTRQLLAYAGQGKFQIRRLDINQLIHDTTALLETALASSAQLELDLMAELPKIEADQGQIQQIVMNLVLNAAEAIHGGQGKVCARTALCTIKEASEFIDYMGEDMQPGRYVVLEVSDNGVGMEQAMLSRIFDPFFSTKTTGHGLGLSAVLGIIRAHHGGIQVTSQPGYGTTFTILLPAQADLVAGPETAVPMTEAPIDHSRAVLVIDDEAPVRDAASEILTDQGFAVLTAAGGEEGIATLSHQRTNIGVVLLDIRMPGMNGAETYQKLRQIEPALKVIFTSGYSESEMSVDLHGTAGVAFLPKPYSAESLSKHVQVMMRHQTSP